MSSLVRRLEKAIMKRAGYTREKWILQRKPTGEQTIVNVPRGGEITDPDDTPIGRRWPMRIPVRARSQTQPPRRNPVAHALRRTKRSQAWFEARAKARGAA